MDIHSAGAARHNFTFYENSQTKLKRNGQSICMCVCVCVYIVDTSRPTDWHHVCYNSWNCVPLANVDGITLSTCLMCSAPSLKTRPCRYREVNSMFAVRCSPDNNRQTDSDAAAPTASAVAIWTGKCGTNHVPCLQEHVFSTFTVVDLGGTRFLLACTLSITWKSTTVVTWNEMYWWTYVSYAVIGLSTPCDLHSHIIYIYIIIIYVLCITCIMYVLYIHIYNTHKVHKDKNIWIKL